MLKFAIVFALIGAWILGVRALVNICKRYPYR